LAKPVVHVNERITQVLIVHSETFVDFEMFPTLDLRKWSFSLSCQLTLNPC